MTKAASTSWNLALDDHCPMGAGIECVTLTYRALPAPKRQMVGPFIFFDQMGPSEFVTGQGVDIRPHPHIGLAPVTCLLQGRLHHRGSLGADNEIAPGDANLMTAGHGITPFRACRSQDAIVVSIVGQWVAPGRLMVFAPAMIKNFCPCRRAE